MFIDGNAKVGEAKVYQTLKEKVYEELLIECIEKILPQLKCDVKGYQSQLDWCKRVRVATDTKAKD